VGLENTDTPECYYYDLIDLLRRLILTGGLIMIGDQAVAQVFLGILVSASWLCLVLYKRPYASAWDTALSAVLSFSLLITLTTGVCLKLFEITQDEADEYQKNAFAVMLIVSIAICVLLSVASIVFSTECLRDRAAAYCAGGASKGTKKNQKTKKNQTAVIPTTKNRESSTDRAKRLRDARLQFGANSDEYRAVVIGVGGNE
jgi:hypothetical protein